MWILYQLATALALTVAGPFLLARRGRHYLESLPGRLGRCREEASGERPLWIHAVSVGEAAVAATLARALPADLPLVVTTITPTGQARARAELAGRAAVCYLPFDLGFAVGRFFRRFRPRALVLAEGDLWPLVLERAKRAGLPVVVVNGRVSDRTFPRLLRLRPLARRLFRRVDVFSVQTSADRERLLELGIPATRIAVTGNLKYDTAEPEPRPDLERQLAALADGRPILVAGSTMAGEEGAVIEALRGLGGGERALAVIAPRHPERFDEVAGLLRAAGLATARRSALPESGRPDAVLLDSLGELSGLYRLAAAAFIGGTLVPTGGHNPLEAARFGVPVAVGPSMENFREMAELFDRAGAWRRVEDARALGRAWEAWLADPAAAARVGAAGAAIVEANRGALARTLALLAPVLDGVSPAAG